MKLNKFALFFCIIIAFLLIISSIAYEQAPGAPGDGYSADCVDNTFECLVEGAPQTCSGELIKPSVDEGSAEELCYNTFDDNCNKDAPQTEWDNDETTGIDCRDFACTGKLGPEAKRCCVTDADCIGIDSGNCGEVYCDPTNKNCATRIVASENQESVCNAFIAANGYQCAAIPGGGICSLDEPAAFPYPTFSCNFVAQFTKCKDHNSCGAELHDGMSYDCSCNPETFECSINQCEVASGLQNNAPPVLKYCYSQCLDLEGVDDGDCPFNNLYDLNAECVEE